MYTILHLLFSFSYSSTVCAPGLVYFWVIAFLLPPRCGLTDGHSAEDMNLSNLLHKGQQNPRQQDPPRSSQSFSDPRARLLHNHRKDMASALTASPYISHSPVYTRSPQPPPSPPIEEPRTLPSIQSLIRMDVPPPNDEQHCESSSTCNSMYETHQICSGCRRPAKRATTARRRASKRRPSIAYIRSTNREQSKCSTAITSH